MLNKRGKSVEIRIGGTIEPARIETLPDDAAATRYLRLRTELLARRGEKAGHASAAAMPVADGVPAELLANEIATLPAECLIENTREFAVYIAEARQIPLGMQEIGRLREIAFRAADEGTGERRDLDRFDPYYLHLFLWNKERREIAGAYRLGEVPKILARFGQKGLYTESLFRFKAGFFARLGPALEMGRSFIRLEYQRQFAPLLLLWKGIGAFVARHPEYSRLIGAVSVSNQYSPASRELIARYFEKLNTAEEWPQRSSRAAAVAGQAGAEVGDSGALLVVAGRGRILSAPISGPRAGRQRHSDSRPARIVRLGGKLLAFSVDPQFGNTLDGFVMVDLTRTNPEILARYMGRERARMFLAWHRTPHPRVA